MVGAGSADQSGGSFVGNWAFRTAVEKAQACGIADSEVQAWLAEQQRLSDEGGFFVCVHRFLFLASRA